MKNFNFKATNRTRKVTGTIIIREGKNKILFETSNHPELNQFVDQDIKVKTVNDPYNLVAAIFAKLDEHKIFNKVYFDDKLVPIKRIENNEKEEFINAIIINFNDTNHAFFDQEVFIKDSNNEQFVLNLSDIISSLNFTAKIPVDKHGNKFAYVKDKMLNEILAYNFINYDYNKKLNNIILKAIKNHKDYFVKQQNIYIDKYFQVMKKPSNHDIAVIPHNIVVKYTLFK